MLTVACVYWKGKFRGRQKVYDASWVGKLKNMVSRNLPIPHRFVCLSNTEVPCERIPLIHDWPGYWSKIELFRPGLFENRVLYLDLDLLILKDLTSFVEFDSDFGIIAKGRNGRRFKEGKMMIHRYNSSVMVFNAGVADDLYLEFGGKDTMITYWGDQDYISHRFPSLDTFPVNWIKKLKLFPDGEVPSEVKIVMCMMGANAPGKTQRITKNRLAAQKYEWADKIWQ